MDAGPPVGEPARIRYAEGHRPGGHVDAEQLIIDGSGALDAFVRAAAAAPEAAALFCDIDGTISPIAPRPAEAKVPERFRDLLATLVERLGLVAFVSGRAQDDARRMIRMDGAAYVGNHGLETTRPDGTVEVEPQAERYVTGIREVAEAAARELDCETLGVILEDKRTVLAVHYRLAPDHAATRHEILTRVVEPARARGLAVATGHFAFEIRPPLPFSKGTAVKRLLATGDYLTALCCGDDLTDVTAFAAIHDWSEHDARRRACAVAAVTGETPRPVLEAADVRVDATAGMYAALAQLRAALGD